MISDSSVDERPSVFHALSRLTVLSAIIWTVWSIAGFHPFSLFISVFLICTAAVLFLLDVFRCSEAIASSRSVLICLWVFLGFGAAQTLDLPIPDNWSGVVSTGTEFGSEGESQSPLTLSRWSSWNALTFYALGVGGFVLGAGLFSSDRARLVLLATIAICGVAQVFWAAVQSVRFPGQIFPGLEMGDSLPYGTFLNRNHAADFVGMAIACCGGLLCWQLRHNSRSRSFSYRTNGLLQNVLASPLSAGMVVALGWLVAGLVFSLSRGAWIAATVSVLGVVGLLQHGKGRLIRFVQVICPLVLLAGLAIQFAGQGDRVTDRLDDLELAHLSADTRLEHWQEAIPAVNRFFPFGSGMGTYGYAYLPFNPKPRSVWFTHAHNQYLELLVETGVVGVLILLVGLVLSLKCLRNLCREDSSATEQAIGFAAGGALIMQVVHAITDFGLAMPANLLTLAILMGAACGVSRSAQALKPGLREQVWAFCVGIVSVAILLVALWHQSSVVAGERLLQLTEPSPAVARPELAVADEWIALVDTELKKNPGNEKLRRRFIQLLLHRSQLNRSARIMAGQEEWLKTDRFEVAWGGATLEGFLSILCDQESELADDAKMAAYQSITNDADLVAAREELQLAIRFNPLQPRVHLRIAELSAAMNGSWKDALSRSVSLSSADARNSFGNGLLAWAADDVETMTSQWKASLSVDSAFSGLLFSLARQKLSEDEVVDLLMPDRWVVPYRLARLIQNNQKFTTLKEKLLKKSDEVAQATLTNPVAQRRARGMIATLAEDFEFAVNLYNEAIKSSPRDADLRYHLAVALLRMENFQRAAEQSRVAMFLEPGNKKYRDLFVRAQSSDRRLRASHGVDPETKNESTK